MPGEIFITMAKEGSTISGLMDAFATSISIALQYNVPLEDLCNKFSHMRFEPNGFTNNRQIPIAKSIMDYIFRYLSLKFLGRTREPVQEHKTVETEITTDKLSSTTGGVHVDDSTNGAAEDLEQIDMFKGNSSENVDPLVGDTVEVFLDTISTGSATSALTMTNVLVQQKTTFTNQEDAPPCSNCGSITVRSGACYSCPNCGATSGCG